MAHLDVVVELPELGIVLGPFDFAEHVGPLEVFDGFDETEEVLFFFVDNLFLRGKGQEFVKVHCIN